MAGFQTFGRGRISAFANTTAAGIAPQRGNGASYDSSTIVPSSGVYNPGISMKVFISWSGETSRAAAEVLRQWLPNVLQFVQPWMSKADIDAGARWGVELNQQLAETQFGILCVTRSNQTAPWLLYEAGALSKMVDTARVCPYLIDLPVAQLNPGPLTQFQAKVAADEGDTLALVKTLNAISSTPLSEAQAERGFGKWWPDLQRDLGALPRESGSPHPTRGLNEMVAETLALVRSMARQREASPLVVNSDLIPSWVTYDTLQDAKRVMVTNALAKTGNIKEAAAMLGVNRSVLYRWMGELGLPDENIPAATSEDDSDNKTTLAD